MTQQETNKIIRLISRNLILAVIPILLAGVGIQVKDHFTLKHKVDKYEWQVSHAELILLVEKKIRALESLAKTNSQDIGHIEQRVKEINTYQKEIDKYLRETYKQRGNNVPPKY